MGGWAVLGNRSWGLSEPSLPILFLFPEFTAFTHCLLNQFCHLVGAPSITLPFWAGGVGGGFSRAAVTEGQESCSQRGAPIGSGWESGGGKL